MIEGTTAGGDGEAQVALDLFGKARKAAEAQLGDRLPPGQRLTEGWPVLHYGNVPRFDREQWRFQLGGLVEHEVSLSYDELRALPNSTVHCDIHCVTHWSKFDNDFTGVKVTDLMQQVQLKPAAKHVMVHSTGGYTTNVSLAELLDDDVLLAWAHGGKDLEPDHGWPLRLVVPKLYFWKSAKWVRGFQFIAGEQPGFWETYGYHIHGDPWTEERYS
jgi:DMSO/TMAO reductase YedYZ molybdopterin-dependent catalytic subunit